MIFYYKNEQKIDSITQRILKSILIIKFEILLPANILLVSLFSFKSEHAMLRLGAQQIQTDPATIMWNRGAFHTQNLA